MGCFRAMCTLHDTTGKIISQSPLGVNKDHVTMVLALSCTWGATEK